MLQILGRTEQTSALTSLLVKSFKDGFNLREKFGNFCNWVAFSSQRNIESFDKKHYLRTSTGSDNNLVLELIRTDRAN